MKRVCTVVASVSRKAGGLYESVRLLTLAVVRRQSFDNVVFGLGDEYTDADIGAWAPVSVEVFRVRGPRIFGYAPGLADALLSSELDLIHNHGIWMYPSIAVSKGARGRAVPYVVSPHGMLDPWALANARWKKLLADSVYERRHLADAACLRALCESEARAIRKFGLKNPICVVPNGVDLPCQDEVDPPAWHAQVPSARKILFYLGRLHPKKNLPRLLQAWARVGSRAQWHLVIAGWSQGGHEQALAAMARALNISDSVSFVGSQFDAEKHASYRHADAFVLPSMSEGLPMVVLEAWAYGLPVLMTAECNLPEGFAEGAAVRIGTDVEGIAAGLEALVAMREPERAEMGVRGRTLVESRFAWPNIGTEMSNVYEWILGGGSKPRSLWE